MEGRPTGYDPGFMLLAGVIEGRRTFHPEAHGAAHHLYATDDPVALMATTRSAYRHVVRDLPDTVGCKEPGDQDVGVRPVELFASSTLHVRGDPEPPAFRAVEDGRKDARGVMVRQAQPVYRPVHTNQGRGVQVTDDPIILYGLVARRVLHSSVLGSGLLVCALCLVGLHLLASSCGAGFAAALLSPTVIRLPHEPSHRHRVSQCSQQAAKARREAEKLSGR